MISGEFAVQVTASSATSRSFLQLLREGESKAWEQLVTLYSPLIYSWCRKMNVPEQDMPDVFQDVFQSVARGIHRFRRDRPGDTFRGWLRTVTQNHVRDYYRRQGRQVQPTGGTDAQRRLCNIPMSDSGDPVGVGTSSAIHARERDVLYQAALTLVRPHFHEQTWQAFWRVAVEGRSPGEVAEELSMRPGTVRVAKSRVLHRLRQELGDFLD